MASDLTISDEPADAMLRRWFAPVLTHGSRWCAPNVDTKCAFVRGDGIELPLTINHAEWDNSWVCSPFTHYVSAAEEEIRRAMGAAVAGPAGLLMKALGYWLRCAQFNRVVMINNWLMSTNPWPVWHARCLPQMIDAMKGRWPDHALVFRSLNARADGEILAGLARQGARLIPSRQVWWFDPDSQAVRESTNWKHDLRLLRRGDLERVPHDALRIEDMGTLTGLYHELYLGKYSRHNAAYTTEWIRHWWSERLLTFTGLREPGGELVGVQACGVINGTMVSPVVGYALSRPRKQRLYPRLAAIPVLAAQEAKLPLNLSAGVGRFKALRGGQPVMESIAVVDAHLPASRQLPWHAIQVLSQQVIAPMVKRRGL